MSRLEESQGVIPLASEWLELDSPDEGIRFDSELVGLLHILSVAHDWLTSIRVGPESRVRTRPLPVSPRPDPSCAIAGQ